MAGKDRLPLLPSLRRLFGRQNESLAEAYLRRKGFRILERNWTTKLGEVDLIARDKKTIVFVEVRSTATDDASRPAASIDDRKQRRLTRLALAYLQKKRLLDAPARFDVICIHTSASDGSPVIQHFESAFEARLG